MATDREAPDARTPLRRETLVVYDDRYRLGLLMVIVALGGVGVGFGLATMAYRARPLPPLARVVPFDVGPGASPSLLRADVCGHRCGRAFQVRPWLGVQLHTFRREHGDALELPAGVVAGAVVTQVFPRSPASAAGIEPGDLIVELDGAAVAGAAEVVERVRAGRAGGEISLTVVRAGERRHLSATLGHRAAND